MCLFLIHFILYFSINSIKLYSPPLSSCISLYTFLYTLLELGWYLFLLVQSIEQYFQLDDEYLYVKLLLHSAQNVFSNMSFIIVYNTRNFYLNQL